MRLALAEKGLTDAVEFVTIDVLGGAHKHPDFLAKNPAGAEAGLLEAVAAYFHHATAGLGPEIETYQNRAWGEKNRERAFTSMHDIDGVLAKQPYLAGDCFTVADITTYAGLAFGDLVELRLPEACRHLRAWREQVARRPSTIAAAG